MSKYGVISGPYYPVFGLNTEIYEVNLRIPSEYRRIRTRNNSVFGYLSRSANNDLWMNNSKIGVRFKGSCLKQDNVAFTLRNVVNLIIVYELDTWLRDLKADFTLKDYLLEAAELTKNANPDEILYSRYGIGI